MNLFNFGGMGVENPLLNALGSAPVGMFSGLNPSASFGAWGNSPLGGGIAGQIAGASPITAPAAQDGVSAQISPTSLAAMFSNAMGHAPQAQPQQVPMGDYAAPQAPVSNPNMIPMNQLVGRLLARGGA